MPQHHLAQIAETRRRFSYIFLIICALGLALSPAYSQFEDVNMNTQISVRDNRIVATWSTSGFDHYNVRWRTLGGAPQQMERAGDKTFAYLTTYQPGVIYIVAVQGCKSNFLSSSRCTSWDEVSCGQPRSPCAGPMHRPIRSGGGLCLDVHAPDQNRNGATVQLWRCNGSDQQLWTIKWPRIISLAGKCLDVHAPDLRRNGGRIQVWDCNGSVQQQWRVANSTIRNQAGKCLDAHLPTIRRDGGRVQVWDCNGTNQQRWVPLSSL